MHHVLFLVLTDFFLSVYEISLELLNRFAPYSQGTRVRVWMSESKVKVTRDKKQYFSALSAACVWFVWCSV